MAVGAQCREVVCPENKSMTHCRSPTQTSDLIWSVWWPGEIIGRDATLNSTYYRISLFKHSGQHLFCQSSDKDLLLCSLWRRKAVPTPHSSCEAELIPRPYSSGGGGWSVAERSTTLFSASFAVWRASLEHLGKRRVPITPEFGEKAAWRKTWFGRAWSWGISMGRQLKKNVFLSSISQL